MDAATVPVPFFRSVAVSRPQRFRSVFGPFSFGFFRDAECGCRMQDAECGGRMRMPLLDLNVSFFSRTIEMKNRLLKMRLKAIDEFEGKAKRRGTFVSRGGPLSLLGEHLSLSVLLRSF